MQQCFFCSVKALCTVTVLILKAKWFLYNVIDILNKKRMKYTSIVYCRVYEQYCTLHISSCTITSCIVQYREYNTAESDIQ